jgi:predicted CoA-binding protein
VFGLSPGDYSSTELTLDPPTNVDLGRVLLPDNPAESGFLTFRSLGGPSSSVDVIAVYRLVEELPGIIASQVRPLGATVLWLQPPAVSAEARQVAAPLGVEFVEGVDIAVAARALAARPSVQQ